MRSWKRAALAIALPIFVLLGAGSMAAYAATQTVSHTSAAPEREGDPSQARPDQPEENDADDAGEPGAGYSDAKGPEGASADHQFEGDE
jgi:hypothetical protein